jgi:putative endonuclease
MSRHRQELGETGENLACRELERRGYAILARRYRVRCGEIDIVARDGDTVVFVEVKTRESLDYGSGGEAVTWRKRQRMAHVAVDYLARAGASTMPCRFDVVSIAYGSSGPAIEVYQNAFDVG